MSSGPITDTQEIIDRIAAIFQPQLKDIKEQLESLVTRREHDKDLAEIKADYLNQQRQIDRMQAWADERPRQSADAKWVERIEQSVHAVEQRLAGQPAEARAWFHALTEGGGCLYMIVALLVSTSTAVIMGLIGIAASAAIALFLR